MFGHAGIVDVRGRYDACLSTGRFGAVVLLSEHGLDVLVGARQLNQLVALFVHQQLALDALEALPAQAPDAVMAESAEGPLQNVQAR